VTGDSAREAVKKFYTELEELSQTHEELTDTDVREAIHDALNFFFVWGNDAAAWPKSFGMFSADGDRKIASALNALLSDVAIRKIQESTPVGEARLQILQDTSIATPAGRRYDEFIGHVDSPLPNQELPSQMMEEGEYDYD
jgi:hypothetical protein